jgi:hypothetical protein
MTDVHLHVGPPKTGSTYLQNLLWAHRADLARQGMVLPISQPNEMWLAVNDVQDEAFAHVEMPEARGAWALVARRVSASSERSVISHEVLGLSTEAHVARIVESLEPADLHVVVMARSLTAILPSLWQETVKMVDSDQSWPEYLTHQQEERSPWTDTAAIVERWLAHVPRERVHVVTVPPRRVGTELGTRFAAALGLNIGGWDLGMAANESLDVVQVELLRRLIASAGATLDRKELRHLINDGLLPHLSATKRPRPWRLPVEHRSWIEDETGQRRQRLQRLRDSGVVVHGNLDDLDVTADVWEPLVSSISDDDVLEAALLLLARWCETSPLDGDASR